jgi:hypothetical protein
MVLDNADMLTPTEKAAYEAWQIKHTAACVNAPARFLVSSAVSGYGFRLRAMCLSCGTREDVTDKAGRDPIPVK